MDQNQLIVRCSYDKKWKMYEKWFRAFHVGHDMPCFVYYSQSPDQRKIS